MTKIEMFKNPLKIFLLLTSCFLFLASSPSALAQILPPWGGPLSSKVQGSVGEYYLSVSGYASPNAAVRLVVGGVEIRSGLADARGYFSISQILIKKGLSSICFETIDAFNLGSSYSCMTITPATGSIDVKDIFLPPTLALSKSEIAVGDQTTAYGYTMPGAEVTLYLSNGTKLSAKADQKGYYEFILRDLKEGKYTVYAKAKYNSLESLSPEKKLTVTVLTGGQQVAKETGATIENFWNWLRNLFTSWGLGILWLVVPIIILIIILIFKLWGDKFSSIFKIKFPSFPRLAFVIPFSRKHKLHHYWWVGY